MPFTFAVDSNPLSPLDCSFDEHKPDAIPALSADCSFCHARTPTIERTSPPWCETASGAIKAKGRLTCCARDGVLRYERPTLFGIAEDEEVLSGKYGRVY